MKYGFTGDTMEHCGYILQRIICLESIAYSVIKDQLGGWIEKESNLSQDGNAWVADEAKVYGNAQIQGNATVKNHAMVWENAIVFGNASVYDDAHVRDDARIYGDAQIFGDARIIESAEVYGDAYVSGHVLVEEQARIYGSARLREYVKIGGAANVLNYTQIFGNAMIAGAAHLTQARDVVWFSSVGSSGRTLTVYKTNDGTIELTRGCFRGSLEQFEAAVAEEHGDNVFGEEYKALMIFVRKRFKLPAVTEGSTTDGTTIERTPVDLDLDVDTTRITHVDEATPWDGDTIIVTGIVTGI
jgi:carbonic anhydrase/acetyltransferase-like protein (isoleucine patch superfamily)